MTKEEALKHEREVFKEGKTVEEVYDADIVDKVARKRAEIAELEKYR